MSAPQPTELDALDALVERLRTASARIGSAIWEDGASSDHVRKVLTEGEALASEAATAITTLRDRLADAERVIKPFAEAAESYIVDTGSDLFFESESGRFPAKRRWFRAARRWLEGAK
jgi:hypothetical protein